MTNPCTYSKAVYRELEELKSNSKGRSIPVEIYIEDSFCIKAYRWLKEANSEGGNNSFSIDQKDKRRIMDNKWKVTASDGKILAEQNRCVVQRQEYFQILANSHSAIAHRGRDKTEAYIRKRYSGISQKVVDFVC